jgi:hypothetical protein
MFYRQDDSLPRGGSLHAAKNTEVAKPSYGDDNLFKSAATTSSTNHKASSGSDAPKMSKKEKQQKKEDIRLKMPVPQFNKGSFAKGMTVMGVITDVRDTELYVSLPNSFTGKVLINELSDYLTQAIQDSVDKGEALPESAELFRLFHPGQIVRCTMLNDAFPLELSLNPRKFNEGTAYVPIS